MEHAPDLHPYTVQQMTGMVTTIARNMPADMAATVNALSYFTVNGPDHDRGIYDYLVDSMRRAGCGDMDGAVYWLNKAASRAHRIIPELSVALARKITESREAGHDAGYIAGLETRHDQLHRIDLALIDRLLELAAR